jgi:putative aminopeptidase FrvX
MNDMLTCLKEFSEAHGVSGYEQGVRSLMHKYLEGFTEISHDKLGSIICKKEGADATPKIMLASHMDEIGFMVKHITKEGYIRFTNLGGWWEHVMLGHRVIVKTRRGDLIGVIGCKPPHILPAEERKKVIDRKELFIDIGAASDEEAKERFGVRAGDPIVPYSLFTPLANEKFLMGKAFDNRVGCAIIVETLKQLSREIHPNTVYGVGTVQEEVGLRGASTSAAVINPDVAFAIDTGVAGDVPGISEADSVTKLGKGVAVSIYDASMIPNLALRDFVFDIAEQNGIPYQVDFMEGGGTDAGRIHTHAHGVPSVVIGIPTRYIHCHNGIIHRDDYEAAVRLMVAMIKKMDAQTVKSFTE